MSLFVIIYVVVLVFMAVPCGVGLLSDTSGKDTRLLARIILLSPIWPLALVGFIIWSIKPLLKMSGWVK
jgi:hypothetical protein